jgi:single-strand DNA-binding protein
MNKVTLIGNVVSDPATSTANKANGEQMRVVKVTLAINKVYKGNKDTSYFNCIGFDKTVEIFEKYVKKGHKVAIVGHLVNSTWDKPDGTKGYATNIYIDELEMLTTKSESDKIENNQEYQQTQKPMTVPTTDYHLPTAPTITLEDLAPIGKIGSMPF